MEHEYECDELLLNLVTPPPEPPKPPRSTLSLRRRVRETPPKFALVSDDFYNRWAEHIDKVKNMKAEVNAAAPPLRPKIYLKPQKFTTYAKQTTDIMTANKDMVKKICLIQRNRGKVECWLKRGDARARRVTTEMLMVRRRKEAAKVQAKNAEAHERIKNAVGISHLV